MPPGVPPTPGTTAPDDSTTSGDTSESDTPTGATSEVTSEGPSTEPGVPADCTFDIDASLSTAIGTVGIVTFSTDLAGISEAKIEFGLKDGDGTMEAPVDLEATDYRTLLLGMKGARDYEFRIVAKAGDKTCTSEPQTITTKAIANAPKLTHTGGAGAGGFVVATPGLGNSPVYIFDTDGDVVWSMAGPAQTSRAHMSYNGDSMWMLALNVQNGGGEMRYVSMDGLESHNNVTGLNKAHHDFCVLPNNGVAAMSWTAAGGDPPSDLIEWSPDGTIKTVVTIDEQIYQSNTYHSNAIHYYPSDDSYTISDRNPNLFVKVSRAGKVLWQFGGSCSGAPTAACAAGDWQVNHGHHLLDDGTFVFFNNGAGGGFGGGGGGGSTIFEYKLTATANSLTATQSRSWTGNSSMVLGDVQRMPSGNVLITWSNSGVIEEKDPGGTTVRSYAISGGQFGYADWRPTLYGPPPRL